LDIDLIKERQQTISLFLRPDNGEATMQAGAVLRRVKNARTAVAQLRRGVDSPSSGQSFDRGVWAILRGFAAQTLRLRDIISSIHEGEQAQIVRKVSFEHCYVA
jgi:DNA mismatch repair protein MSH5